MPERQRNDQGGWRATAKRSLDHKCLIIQDGVIKKKINVCLERNALPLMSSSPFLLRLSEVCSIHGLLGLLGEILHSGGPKWQLDKLCPPGMNGTYTASSLSR